MVKLRGILFIVVFFGLVFQSFCQEEDIFGITRKARPLKSESQMGNIFRNAFEQFSFQLSTGAAHYALNTEFYRGNQVYPITQYQANADFEYYPLPDTLSFSSRELILPTIEAGLRLNLFNILTVGGGYGLEQGNLTPFEGGGYQFSLQGTNYRAANYFASAGVVIFDASRRRFLLKQKYKKYEKANPDLKMRMKREYDQRIRQNYPWTISVEGEIGRFNLIPNNGIESYAAKFLNTALYNYERVLVGLPEISWIEARDIETLNQLRTLRKYQPRLGDVKGQITYAAALRISYDLSEYASVFAKGKYMQRVFVNNSTDFIDFPMNQELYSVQVGMAMKLPGTKRCKINGCGVVMKHRHNGIEYRGSSIFNLQNRKIGQWY
uniref:hypothetical protein n=1 Tax=Algoriphagus sp. TaxID=1872435 RepID=UPI0040484F5E